MRLFCQPRGGCWPVSRPIPWACVLGLWATFTLGTISNKIKNGIGFKSTKIFKEENFKKEVEKVTKHFYFF